MPAWGCGKWEMQVAALQPPQNASLANACDLPSRRPKIFAGHITRHDEATRPSEEIMVSMEDAAAALAAAKTSR